MIVFDHDKHMMLDIHSNQNPDDIIQELGSESDNESDHANHDDPFSSFYLQQNSGKENAKIKLLHEEKEKMIAEVDELIKTFADQKNQFEQLKAEKSEKNSRADEQKIVHDDGASVVESIG
jgi:hypothetical protein